MPAALAASASLTIQTSAKRCSGSERQHALPSQSCVHFLSSSDAESSPEALDLGLGHWPCGSCLSALCSRDAMGCGKDSKTSTDIP